MAGSRKVAIVNDGTTQLASYAFAGMSVGMVVTDTTGQSWQLSASAATVDHTSIEAAAGNPGLRWLAYSGGPPAATTWLSSNPSDGAPSLTAAIAAQSARGGGVVYAPSGVAPLQSKVTGAANVVVEGAGYGATRFVIDDSLGNVPIAFQWTDKRYFGLRKCSISAAAKRTAGLAINIKGGDPTVPLGSFAFGAGQGQIDVDMDNQFNGVLIEDSATCGNWGATIGDPSREAIWRNFAATGNGITLKSPSGGSHKIRDIFFAGSIGNEWASAVRVLNTGDLTMQDCSTFHCGYGFLMDPSTPFCLTGAFINLLGNEFDSTSLAANADCIRLAPTDRSRPVFVNISGGWIAGGYNGFRANNFSGANCIANISASIIYSNSNYGVYCDNGTTTANVFVIAKSATVEGTVFSGNGNGAIAFV